MRRLCQLLWFSLVFVFATSIAHAKEVGNQDLLGTWYCHKDFSDLGLLSTSLDTFHQDGTMSQLWEVNTYEPKDAARVEFFTIKNRWQLVKDELKFSDMQIVNYQIYDYLSPNRKIDQETYDLLKSLWQIQINEMGDTKVTLNDTNHLIYLNDDGSQDDVACIKKS